MGLVSLTIRAVAGLAVLGCGLSASLVRAPDSSLGTRLTGSDTRAELQAQLATTPLPIADIDRLARARVLAAPLDPLPFEAKLAAEVSAGPIPQRLEGLTEAALARNGRSQAARLLRFSRYLEVGDWTAVIREFERLYDLFPEKREDLLGVLEAQMADASARHIIVSQISHDAPAWGRSLVVRFTRNDVPLDTLVALYRPYPDIQGRLISGLAREGQYDLAYLAWVLLRPSELAHSGLPIDGTFKGIDAPTPFNWTIDKRRAELLPGGGLYVVFLGTARPRIVHQSLPLAPGSYELAVTFDGDLPHAAGALMWTLRCAGGESVILQQAMANDTQGWVFNVPEAGCDFQELTLSGEPGEYAQPIRLTLRSVQINALDRTL